MPKVPGWSTISGRSMHTNIAPNPLRFGEGFISEFGSAFKKKKLKTWQICEQPTVKFFCYHESLCNQVLTLSGLYLICNNDVNFYKHLFGHSLLNASLFRKHELSLTTKSHGWQINIANSFLSNTMWPSLADQYC